MLNKILIVGLGNFGEKYSLTRHNIGFHVVQMLCEHFGAVMQHKNAIGCAITSVKVDIGVNNVYNGSYTNLTLCTSMGYMNSSGIPIKKALSFCNAKTTEMLVIHDDIDLNFGQLKWKFGGGNGGHNGLRSIDQILGNAYHRLRIGVGRPSDINISIADFVLSRFSQNELSKMNDILSSFLKNEISERIKDILTNKRLL